MPFTLLSDEPLQEMLSPRPMENLRLQVEVEPAQDIHIPCGLRTVQSVSTHPTSHSLRTPLSSRTNSILISTPESQLKAAPSGSGLGTSATPPPGANVRIVSGSSSSRLPLGDVPVHMELEDSENKRRVMKRLSKRLSISRLPTTMSGFVLENGYRKLYVSETDRANPFKLAAATYDRLYGYQREGVRWLWERYCNNSGGLLGDDMGLGKTIQIIAFLDGLFHAHRIRYALIVLPVSLLANWLKELEAWAPKLMVVQIHDASKKQRGAVLRRVKAYGGVCLTSYGLITSDIEAFTGAAINWDYVILDEGHKIKNPSIQLSKNVRRLYARQRLVITGTPIQNNLVELWSLFDFICQGRLLGSQNEFKQLVADTISRGNERCASLREKARGAAIADTLQDLIQPYFLRREKKAVLATPNRPSFSGSVPVLEAKKFDYVVWLKMTPVQLDFYHRVLTSKLCKESCQALEAANKNRASFNAFCALEKLKFVCDHPWLLLNDAEFDTVVQRIQWSGRSLLDHEATTVDVPLRLGLEAGEIPEAVACSMIGDCAKLAFACELLEALRGQGHRALLFSRSLKMLNLLQLWLESRKVRFLRIDGRVKHPADRQRIVDQFNKDSTVFCCLLTAKVGGVGLTLTGADRVIVVDPDWNPSTDNQAVDRAYRISQTRDVVVYRLITCGTLEEKIYRQQVFKQGLALNAMGADGVYRHFSRKDLKEMFKLGVTDLSETADRQHALYRDQMQYPAAIEDHLADLRTMFGFANFSDNGLVFDKKELVAPCAEAQHEAVRSRERLKASRPPPPPPSEAADASPAQPPRKRGRPMDHFARPAVLSGSQGDPADRSASDAGWISCPTQFLAAPHSPIQPPSTTPPGTPMSTLSPGFQVSGSPSLSPRSERGSPVQLFAGQDSALRTSPGRRAHSPLRTPQSPAQSIVSTDMLSPDQLLEPFSPVERAPVALWPPCSPDCHPRDDLDDTLIRDDAQPVASHDFASHLDSPDHGARQLPISPASTDPPAGPGAGARAPFESELHRRLSCYISPARSRSDSTPPLTPATAASSLSPSRDPVLDSPPWL